MVERSMGSPPDLTEQGAGTSFPERVGPCRLLRPLGSGATGTVFLAELVEERPWASAGDRVALKLLHPELTRASRALRRFMREGRVGHGIRHPCVVRTHEAASSEANGATLHYIVQEYVEGTTLCDLIREWGVIPEPMLRRLGAQLARGLAAIHGAGAIHRDLKPANVLLTSGHEVKIADLGIARLFEEDASLTATGDFVGTPHHAAPEQFEGEGVGPEADLYAMGVLLHEAATGRLPFVSSDRHGLRRLHVGHVPPPASTIHAQVSALLDELIAGLLEKIPSRRPGPASELAEILERGEDSRWWRERRSGPSPRAARSRRVRHAAPLTGRTEEMRALRSLLEAGPAGSGPRVLLVEGDAGMGKSRLADELVAEAEARRAIVLWGGNAPAPSGASRGAIAQSLLDHHGSDDLERRLAAHLGSSRGLAAAVAAHLLGASASSSAPSAREDVTRGIAILVGEMSRNAPLLWVLEDLHFAQPGEIAMLAAIAPSIESDAVGIVATTRPTLAHADRALLAALPGYGAHVVPRLQEPHVRELMAHAAPSLPASSRMAATLTRRTDGVPYFLFELLRSLDGKGSADLASLDSDARIDVPESLRHLLLARLEGIEPADREILDAAAVVGDEVDPALVAAVLRRDVLDVLRAFARLERAHGVMRGIGDRVAFAHHLLHEVASTAMLPMLRRELHGRVADALEAAAGTPTGRDLAAIVAHRVEAGQHARACEHAVAAIRWLAHAGRHAQVAELAPRILVGARADDLALRTTLMTAGVEALTTVGRSNDARLLAEEAIPIATAAADPGALTDLCVSLAAEASTRGDTAAEDQWNARALEVGETCADRSHLARVLMSRGLRLQIAARIPEARADYERAYECATQSGDRGLAAQALARLAHNLSRTGDLDGAHGMLLRARDLAKDLESAQHAGRSLVTLVQSHVLRRETAEARLVVEEALTIARDFGRRPLEASTLQAACDLELAAGNLVESRSLATRAVAVRRAMRDQRHDSPAWWTLCTIARLEGNLDEADEFISGTLERSRATDARVYLAECLKMQGENERFRGNVEAARELFTQAGDLHGGTTWGVETFLRRARVEVESGLLEAARASLDEVERRNAEIGGDDGPSAMQVYDVLAGRRHHDLDAIPDLAQEHENADVQLALHLAGHAGDHLAEAMRMLEHLSRHLSGDALERFWRWNVTARRAREAAS
jgi:tetratricopeptide (TPR) repeat protein/tRNA A-37 threonylcarbamoyl transferase component Bud32